MTDDSTTPPDDSGTDDKTGVMPDTLKVTDGIWKVDFGRRIVCDWFVARVFTEVDMPSGGMGFQLQADTASITRSGFDREIMTYLMGVAVDDMIQVVIPYDTSHYADAEFMNGMWRVISVSRSMSYQPDQNWRETWRGHVIVKLSRVEPADQNETGEKDAQAPTVYIPPGWRAQVDSRLGKQSFVMDDLELPCRISIGLESDQVAVTANTRGIPQFRRETSMPLPEPFSSE